MSHLIPVDAQEAQAALDAALASLSINHMATLTSTNTSIDNCAVPLPVTVTLAQQLKALKLAMAISKDSSPGNPISRACEDITPREELARRAERAMSAEVEASNGARGERGVRSVAVHEEGASGTDDVGLLLIARGL